MGRWGGKHLGYRMVTERTGPGVSGTRVRIWLCHCQLCDLDLLNGQNNHTSFPGRGNGRWYRQNGNMSEGTGERGRDEDLGERAAPSSPKCGTSPDSEGTPTLSLLSLLPPKRHLISQTQLHPSDREGAGGRPSCHSDHSNTQPRCEACARLSQEPRQHRMLTGETEAQAGWCPGHTARRWQPSPEALALRLPGASGQLVG